MSEFVKVAAICGPLFSKTFFRSEMFVAVPWRGMNSETTEKKQKITTAAITTPIILAIFAVRIICKETMESRVCSFRNESKDQPVARGS